MVGFAGLAALDREHIVKKSFMFALTYQLSIVEKEQ
jgi:hypothetical protein